MDLKQILGGAQVPNLSGEGSTNPASAFSHLTPLIPDALPNKDGQDPIPVTNETDVKIYNVVATVNLKCQLDLKHIATYVRNAEYNPRRFAAAIVRILEPKATALVFRTGKMVVTGAANEDDCLRAARRFCRILQKVKCPVRFTDFKVENIVGVTNVGFSIDLEALHVRHSKFAQYEPELFPGLIYRIHEPKVCLLIFVTGRVVCTGAKSREAIYSGLGKIRPVLNDFKARAPPKDLTKQ
ncbi:hypothetical protein P9112_009386 [Eukaryota sp. TZLM1-RC]